MKLSSWRDECDARPCPSVFCFPCDGDCLFFFKERLHVCWYADGDNKKAHRPPDGISQHDATFHSTRQCCSARDNALTADARKIWRRLGRSSSTSIDVQHNEHVQRLAAVLSLLFSSLPQYVAKWTSPCDSCVCRRAPQLHVGPRGKQYIWTVDEWYDVEGSIQQRARRGRQVRGERADVGGYNGSIDGTSEHCQRRRRRLSSKNPELCGQGR